MEVVPADAQGPISPNRSGDICTDDIVALLKKGKTIEEINELASTKEVW